MLDVKTTTYLSEKFSSRAPEVQRAILKREHHTAVLKATTAFGIDGEAREALELEVLYVLLGLQTVSEFEKELENNSVLSVDEGRKFAQDIRKTLFAELALYLPGMEESSGARNETLASCIDADSEVQARLTKLPESVQAMVQSVQLEEAFATLQKKHHLDSPITRSLGEQVVRVMVGLTTMNDFKVNVTRVAGIPPSSLDALFMDVEQTLFKPVRTTILGALQKNINSLPDKESSPAEDPYRTPVK